VRILAVVPYPPRADATHGGARAAAGLLLGLANRHPVAIAYLRESGEPPLDEELRDQADTVVEVAMPDLSDSVWAQRRRRARAAAGGRPTWAAQRSVPEFHERIGVLNRTWKPDVAQLHFQVASEYGRDLSGVPNVLVVYEPGAAHAAAGRRGPSAWLDETVWRRFERRALRDTDATVALTERDREALLELGQPGRIEVIPLGIDIPPEPLDAQGRDEIVCFVGNFRHTPNVDAARRLATAIFPRVAAERPRARLRLVGADPPPEVVALTGDLVEVAGSVPDVTPELDRAAVVAIPLRLGGGMRVKTLEALAAGKAVVASPAAVEGIDVTDGVQIRLAEDDEEFAAAISELLDSPERRVRLAGAARAWAERYAGWDGRVDQHERLLRSLVEPR
jgi:glycosyltransferase involved in cell wall biosynthesis